MASFFERMAVKILEAGQKKFSSAGRRKNIPTGMYLGRSSKPYWSPEEEDVFFSPEQRSGHYFIIGGTGTGKTTFIENCLRHDILQNKGWCLVDAHGDIAGKIVQFLAALWQKKDAKQKEEMARRLILVEPFNSDRVVGFNPLEVSRDGVYATALEMTSVFEKRWPDFGPRMKELLRVCLLTLTENKMTLLELPVILTNREARDFMVSNLVNEEVKAYWISRYNTLSQGLENQYREPVLNKVTEFLTDENLRCLFGQAKSSIDLRRAMDQGKWVVLNISKGKLRSNATLLGGLFLAKLQLDGLSRSDIPAYQRRPFNIYVDESQNFLNAREGGDIETLLSESRKYSLGLTLANQNLGQLDNSLLNAILGNVNVLLCFRQSYKDALVLAPELDPADKKIISENLIKLKTGEAYFKLKGTPARMVKTPLPKFYYVHPKVVEEFKQLSWSFCARSSGEIKKEIAERHRRLGVNNTVTGGNYIARKANPMEGQNEW